MCDKDCPKLGSQNLHVPTQSGIDKEIQFVFETNNVEVCEKYIDKEIQIVFETNNGEVCEKCIDSFTCLPSK